ncbi:hypothetical protein V8E55_001918 [Tylopilus felleus]
MTIWQRHRVAAKQLERRRRPMPHHRVACFLRACRLLPFLCFCPLFHRLRLVTPPCAIGITRSNCLTLAVHLNCCYTVLNRNTVCSDACPCFTSPSLAYRIGHGYRLPSKTMRTTLFDPQFRRPSSCTSIPRHFSCLLPYLLHIPSSPIYHDIQSSASLFQRLLWTIATTICQYTIFCSVFYLTYDRIRGRDVLPCASGVIMRSPSQGGNCLVSFDMDRLQVPRKVRELDSEAIVCPDSQAVSSSWFY